MRADFLATDPHNIALVFLHSRNHRHKRPNNHMHTQSYVPAKCKAMSTKSYNKKQKNQAQCTVVSLMRLKKHLSEEVVVFIVQIVKVQQKRRYRG